MSERARVRRHYGLLCSMFVATKSGSICIATKSGSICIAVVLVSVSGGVIVLSSERLVGEVVGLYMILHLPILYGV